MALPTIVTRASKGSALTWVEGDANFTNLRAASIPTGNFAGATLLAQSNTPGDYGWTNAQVIAQGAISVTSGGGDGYLEYENGVITYYGPMAYQYRAAFSAGDNISISDGIISATGLPSGGLAGEYLVKNSATNYDYSWTDRVNAKTIYETVKNVSGVSLSKGTPVYQVGVTGNTVTVAAARADDPNKLAIGVLNETIANQAEGQMIILGEIKGVNTSTFSTGDKVYLGTTGGYTNIAPNTPGVAVQFLGVVFRVNATNGSGYITGTLSEDYIKYNGSGFELWDGDSWVVLTTEIRGSISVSDSGGDGSLSYNSTTGVITYAGPSVSDYRAAFTAGTNITIVDGVISSTGGGSGAGETFNPFLLMGA